MEHEDRIWEQGLDLLVAEANRRKLWGTGLDFTVAFGLFVEIVEAIHFTADDICGYLKARHGLPDAQVATVSSAYRAVDAFLTRDIEWSRGMWSEDTLNDLLGDLRVGLRRHDDAPVGDGDGLHSVHTQEP